MSKELTIAIILGILLGFVVGFGIWRANKSFKENEGSNTQPESTSSTPLSTEGETPSNKLVALTDPTEGEIMTEKELRVNGITLPTSYIALISEKESFIERSDEKGVFGITVTLSPGVNSFMAKVLEGSELKGDTPFRVIYSSEFYESFNSSDPKASDSADIVAQQKIELLKKSPISYMGTLTDIAGRTLEIEGIGGEILQASANDKAVLVNANKNFVEFKFEDLAIGDHVALLGFKNENGVLDTYRILLTPPSDFSDRFMVTGKITEIKGKVVSIQGKEEISLQFPARWEGPEIKEIEVDDTVLALGALKDGKYTVETIEIIASNFN